MKKILLCLVSLLASVTQADLLLTGQMVAGQSQNFITPWSNSWRIQLKWMRDEGDVVKAGDLIVVFDTANIESEIDQQKASLRATQEQTREKVLRLEQDVIDAEHGLTQAKLNAQLAKLEADIPQTFRSEFEHESAQFDKIKSDKSIVKALAQLKSKKGELTAELAKQQLEIQRIEAGLQKKQAELSQLHLYAKQPGPVLHALHPRTGLKISAGQSVQTRWKVASIASHQSMKIKAWINEVDWPQVKKQQSVMLMADAHPGHSFAGKIVKIGQQAEKKHEWGNASYYEVDIEFNDKLAIRLIPGMSIQVRVLNSVKTAS